MFGVVDQEVENMVNVVAHNCIVPSYTELGISDRGCGVDMASSFCRSARLKAGFKNGPSAKWREMEETPVWICEMFHFAAPLGQYTEGLLHIFPYLLFRSCGNVHVAHCMAAYFMSQFLQLRYLLPVQESYWREVECMGAVLVYFVVVGFAYDARVNKEAGLSVIGVQYLCRPQIVFKPIVRAECDIWPVYGSG